MYLNRMLWFLIFTQKISTYLISDIFEMKGVNEHQESRIFHNSIMILFMINAFFLKKSKNSFSQMDACSSFITIQYLISNG